MDRRLKEQYILNSTFLLANKLQLAGDNLCDDITLKQFLLLNIIKNWQEGLPNMNDLAALMGCSRQNIKNIVIPLKNKGYIKIKNNNSDKRSTAIMLSKKGIEYFKDNQKQTDIMLNDFFHGIELNDIELYCQVMNKIFENIDNILSTNI